MQANISWNTRSAVRCDTLGSTVRAYRPLNAIAVLGSGLGRQLLRAALRCACVHAINSIQAHLVGLWHIAQRPKCVRLCLIDNTIKARILGTHACSRQTARHSHAHKHTINRDVFSISRCVYVCLYIRPIYRSAPNETKRNTHKANTTPHNIHTKHTTELQTRAEPHLSDD